MMNVRTEQRSLQRAGPAVQLCSRNQTQLCQGPVVTLEPFWPSTHNTQPQHGQTDGHTHTHTCRKTPTAAVWLQPSSPHVKWGAPEPSLSPQGHSSRCPSDPTQQERRWEIRTLPWLRSAPQIWLIVTGEVRSTLLDLKCQR